MESVAERQQAADAQSTGPGPLALLGRTLGIRMARGIDHESVLATVRDEAGWSHRYAFMTLMSAGIALLGLLLSSPAVVIGAMLVSPLMGPIIGLGFAFATFDWPRVRESGLALAAGSAMAVAFCAAIVLLSPLQTATSEIMARTRPNLFDLLVAVFSALAGAYATVRAKGATIVGVAIATALMPPLAVVGYGLATGQRPVWAGAFALFVTNFVAIAASAAVMARLYGFGTRLSPRHTRLQAWLLLGLMALLAVPLGWALRDIAGEAAAGREVRRAIGEVLGEDARLTELDVRRDGSVLRVDAVAVAPGFVVDARRRVEAEVEQRVGRDVDLRLVQIRAEDGERIAAVEAGRASDARRAAADAEAQALRARLALVSGRPPEGVAIDTQTRTARVGLPAGNGLAVTAMRELEQRLARDFPGWTVLLVPAPATPWPDFRFAPGSATPDAAAARAAQAAAWMAARLEAPGLVATGMAAPGEAAPAGSDDTPLDLARARAIVALLRDAGLPTAADVQPAEPGLISEQGLAAVRAVRLRAATAAEAAAARAEAEAETAARALAGGAAPPRGPPTATADPLGSIREAQD